MNTIKIVSNATAETFKSTHGVTAHKVNEHLLSKCLDLMKDIDNGSYIDGDILHEYDNEMHFIYFSAGNCKPTFIQEMHRYFMAVYSPYFTDLYFLGSNVIDKDANYTIKDVKSSFKAYVRGLNKKIENL